MPQSLKRVNKTRDESIWSENCYAPSAAYSELLSLATNRIATRAKSGWFFALISITELFDWIDRHNIARSDATDPANGCIVWLQHQLIAAGYNVSYKGNHGTTSYIAISWLPEPQSTDNAYEPIDLDSVQGDATYHD